MDPEISNPESNTASSEQFRTDLQITSTEVIRRADQTLLDWQQ
jgi:hypothetical protein